MKIFYHWNALEDWMATNAPMYTRVSIYWYDSLHACRTALTVYRNEYNTFAVLGDCI